MNETIEQMTDELTQAAAEAGSMPQEPAEESALTFESSQENAPVDELTQLREEVERLRAELSRRSAAEEASMRELEEFHGLFPDVPVRSVPDGIWEQVNRGIPLGAAYALYEKKQKMAEARAEQVNRHNASHSAGKAGKHTAGEYFSPDEVRTMSQKQVHDNYQKILESMKSWK